MYSGSDLVNKAVCTLSTENCYRQQCDNCSSRNGSDLLMIDEDDLDETLDTNWSLWVTTNNRVELQHFHGSFRSLIEQLNSRWSSFITHTYVTRQQREYIKTLKLTSTFTTFAVIHVDFAENFTFVIQKEIQSAYWNTKQSSLYTIVLDIGNDHRNMVIISNRMQHDTTFVYCTQQLIVKFIREEYPTVSKINYVRYEITLFYYYFSHMSYFLYSDGAPAQYKNNNNMTNLSLHEQDFGIKAVWTFTSSGHGKSPCDGLGAVIKSSARKYLLKHGPEMAFSSAKDFYNFTLEKTSRTTTSSKPTPSSKTSANTIQSSNNDCSSDEDKNETNLKSPRSIEVRWLDQAHVEKTFEKTLKPRWTKLSPRSNGTILCTNYIFFLYSSSYFGY